MLIIAKPLVSLMNSSILKTMLLCGVISRNSVKAAITSSSSIASKVKSSSIGIIRPVHQYYYIQ